MASKLNTVVLGASLKPERYAYRAVEQLAAHGHPVTAVGLRTGFIGGVAIQTGKPIVKGVHTVTLYLNANRQKEFYEYILALSPRRVIFNPGAENPELESLLEKQGIEATEACTLVLLSTGQY